MTLTYGTVTTILLLVLTAAAVAGGDMSRERVSKKAGVAGNAGTPTVEAKPARAGSQATHFNFTKKGVLISRPSKMPTPGPYWTTLVKMADVHGFPHEYALYFSTDHGRKGGIWLYVCTGSPTEADNWKSYDRAVADGDFDYLKDKPTANPIFRDTTQGWQTETPCANVIDGVVYMTYHNCGAGHAQSTLLATSKDGVNFARIHGDKDSVILDYDPRKAPGNGHTGYFHWGRNPFAGVHYKYVGYSLHGGGDKSHSAMWGSNNPVKWDKLQVFDHIEGYAIEKDRFIKWPEIDPNSITPLGNGEYVAICVGGTRSSGSKARVNELYEIFIASDGKTLTRNSRKILVNGPPGDGDSEELSEPTTIVVGGVIHLIYVGTSKKARANVVMGASGKLDRSAPKAEPLNRAQRQRHFIPK